MGAYFVYKTPAPPAKRFYHLVTVGVTLIASLAYLTMATGHGYYMRPFDCRQFFYARYVDWAFTTPLQLIDLLGFAGATSDTTFFLLGVDLKESAKGLGKDAEGVYNKISMLTAITWACYPVVWLFAEGSNKLSADTEAYAYTFLDILSKSVFGFIIISGRDALEAVYTKA